MSDDLMQRLIDSIAEATANNVARRHHADPDGHGACICGEPPLTQGQWIEHIQTETRRYMGDDA